MSSIKTLNFRSIQGRATRWPWRCAARCLFLQRKTSFESTVRQSWTGGSTTFGRRILGNTTHRDFPGPPYKIITGIRYRDDAIQSSWSFGRHQLRGPDCNLKGRKEPGDSADLGWAVRGKCHSVRYGRNPSSAAHDA